LSHAVVAKARQLPVRSITLFALGGVAQIEKEAGDPGTEFLMGIIGPITSALIGVICLALAWSLGWSPVEMPRTPVLAILMWLGFINIFLAIFNLIPGFPLDGGRVLRAILWWVTGDGVKATKLAARVGQIIAFAFIIIGVVRFFRGEGIGALWIAFIGWFLLEAAGASRMQVDASEKFRGVHAGDLVERNCVDVDGRDNLQDFVKNYLLRTGNQCFLVRHGGDIEGIITPFDVMEKDRSRWPETTVEQAMRPVNRLPSVSADAPITEAIEIMEREKINELPVARNGQTEGFITRGGLSRLLHMRAMLEM